MKDARREVLAWLEFARELGVDVLPAPPPVAGAGAAAPEAPAEPAPGRAAGGPAGAARPSPVERLRAALRSGAARPPAGSAGKEGAAREAAPAPAARPGPAPPRRLEGIPDELLATPADLFSAAVPAPGRARTLEEVREEIGDCRRCKLSRHRTNIVFGAGDPMAELVFVGEGPGREEDLQGLPFVGRAGQLLTDIIRAIGLSRDRVYICNVVKCRPPENRTPEPDEVAACRGFLFKQLGVIRPKVVVALGKPAAETLLRRPVSISEARGQVLDFFGAKLVLTFHPAYLLRNPAKKREVWEDMKKVRDLLRAP